MWRSFDDGASWVLLSSLGPQLEWPVAAVLRGSLAVLGNATVSRWFEPSVVSGVSLSSYARPVSQRTLFAAGEAVDLEWRLLHRGFLNDFISISSVNATHPGACSGPTYTLGDVMTVCGRLNVTLPSTTGRYAIRLFRAADAMLGDAVDTSACGTAFGNFTLMAQWTISVSTSLSLVPFFSSDST